MVKVYAIGFAAAGVLLNAGCGTVSDSGGDGIDIVNNEEALAERMTLRNQSLALVDPGTSGATLAGASVTLTLISEVTGPTVAGTAVQAADVFLHDNTAYVGYNTQGEVQRGAADIIDIQDKGAPAIRSQVSFADADVNAIYYDNNQLYLTGADTQAVPAYVKAIQVTAGSFVNATMSTTVSSYAGNDILVAGNYAYVTSGSDGGLAVLNKQNLSPVTSQAIATARSVDISGNKLRVLAGMPGTMHRFDKEGVSEGNAVGLGGASIAESKSTIAIDSQVAVVAIGDGGTKFVCLDDDVTLLTIAAVTVAGIDQGKTVTNAAYLANDLLFTANGEAGVYVYEITTSNKKTVSTCKDRTASLLGRIDFGTDLSANHVYYKNGFLFVADGLGGLKIVGVEVASGS